MNALASPETLDTDSTLIGSGPATTGSGGATRLRPGTGPLAALENLNVWFADAHGHRHHVVHDVSLHIDPGECVAVIGESGSGKSVTARTLIGLTGPDSHVAADTAEVFGRPVHGLRDADWKSLRGRDIGFILQDALVSLDPLRAVGVEIAESLRLHGVRDRTERSRQVRRLLAEVGVPDPALVATQRPDQLSGGLRQRALIASAIANDPSLVVADEPTTALDVTVQAQVLDLLAQRKADGTAILLISHDFSVVGRLADRVLVMQGGRIVESGTAGQILRDPQHPYTRQLLDAVPSGHTRGEYLTEEARVRAAVRAAGTPGTTPAGTSQREAPAGVGYRVEDPSDAPAVLSARGLTKSYRGPDGRHRAVVRDVSFDVHAGRTLGIVGESGSGKSTTASMALGFIAPDDGTVLLDGAPWSELSVAGRRSRRREVTVVYQDPLSSFDPRWTGERILVDALDGGAGPGSAPGLFASARARRAHRAERSERAAELARLVGLDPDHLAKHPLRLSGGQRQRLSIARALAPEPKVVVLDEAVSALDVSVQAQVLDLLSELQETLGTTYLFISHDLGVIHHMSHEILVMKDGAAVEHGDADRVFEDPQHAYTQSLLASLQALSTATR